MHTCTKKNHARAHCRKNPRTFSEPKKEHITSIHVARKKQIPSPWKGLKNHLHTPPQKSKGPSLSDEKQMHSSPRWIFFSDNQKVLSFTRREWWKQKKTLNPKQNLSKPVTPLQTSVVDKLSTSSILYRATFYQLDVSIESTKRIYQGPKVLSWWVRFILDKHDIINDWNLTKSWTKWKLLDNF